MGHLIVGIIFLVFLAYVIGQEGIWNFIGSVFKGCLGMVFLIIIGLMVLAFIGYLLFNF